MYLASQASETLGAWERVVRIAPDRADGWLALGESFYFDGELLGIHDGPVRAAAAFRRALELNPSFAPARRMLTLVLARQGDPAVVPGGGVHAVGSQVGIVVALELGKPAVELEVEQDRSEELHRGLRLGEVDVLTLTGAAAVIESRQQRGERDPR